MCLASMGKSTSKWTKMHGPLLRKSVHEQIRESVAFLAHEPIQPLVWKRSSYISFSHDFGVFAIEFWPAWLSPRMRLSSPDHSPLIARTRVLAIFSSCRFSSYNTASGRFYQPGETFMTHFTYSGLCCFFFFFFKY